MGASIEDEDKSFHSWEEIQPCLSSLRKQTFKQLLALWSKYKDVDGFEPLWGDEVEYILVHFDDTNKRARLALCQQEILGKWAEKQNSTGTSDARNEFQLQPECLLYMVEMAADPPFGPGLRGILRVEDNLARRRKAIQSLLGDDEAVLTIPVFPRLGTVEPFTQPPVESSAAFASSSTSPDSLSVDFDPFFSKYKRFKCFAQNMRRRRGREFGINLPLCRSIPDETAQKGLFLEGLGFAMGVCGLQVTMQARNLPDACLLHDQLAVLGPLMLAMTAATPAYKGVLADTDARWDIFRFLNDDRTAEEQNADELLEQHTIDAKLRSGVSPIYISNEGTPYQSYLPSRPSQTAEELHRHDVNPNLAAHLSHFCQWDPLLLETDHINTHGPDDTYHFSTLYRSSWPHVRLKFPEGEKLGWRVEFRPMEVQLTDFENAAFIVFVVLLRHALGHYGVRLYIPMQCVVENMQTAVKRDAAISEAFWFEARRGDGTIPMMRRDSGIDVGQEKTKVTAQRSSLQDIFCGPPTTAGHGTTPRFPGFIPLIKNYLAEIAVSHAELGVISRYLDFIESRASGTILTNARWIRREIQLHSSYRGDGLVSQEACYDVCSKIRDMAG
ncbi:glutamate-cysteine ligase-domain-containing protein [Aspergillus undulatus]|uniref:glutamate-cysteine ligase-domain-containing protein n=1 Tax=Aspergillus undulatus TaxID=1810928 RepID=UPI003CCE308D